MAEPRAPLAGLSDDEARAVLLRCCGSLRWVAQMLQRRPFASQAALLGAAEQCFANLEEDDYLEAFAHHPRIGEDVSALRARFASTAELADAEQAGTRGASEATLEALAEGNRDYLERFGFLFIICATGKSADRMLEALQQRLANTRAQELVHAIAEQVDITKLRLCSLSGPAEEPRS